MKKVVILHNIISPYKTLLFNALSDELNGNLEVVYFAETAGNREWNIDYDKMRFAYHVLNKGCLEKISSWALCSQIRKYLTAQAESIATVVAGEYNGLAYWHAWWWSWFHCVPFGSIMESTEKDHNRHWAKEKIKSLFFHHCQYVFAAGTLHAQYVNRLGVAADKIHVIGGVGGVDTKIYVPLARSAAQMSKEDIQLRLGLANRKYFIYVGRFSAEKNLFTLLDAFARFQQVKPDWGLLLVGSGPQEAELKEYIRVHCLSNVVFAGFIQQDDLPWFYLASEVFILPSTSEPWGLVVDEALALGLPVIVSNRCGCVAELVQNGVNGVCFNPDNASELALAMQALAADEKLRNRMGQKSRTIAIRFSPANSAKSMASVLRNYTNRGVI